MKDNVFQSTPLVVESISQSTENDIALSPHLAGRYKIMRNNSSQMHKRTKRESASQEEAATIEIAIFTDVQLFSYVKTRYQLQDSESTEEKLTKMILALLKSVQIYFDHESLSSILELKIVHIHMDKEEQEFERDSNIRNYLENFCLYQTKKMLIEKIHWDHALLLTGLDLFILPGPNSDSAGEGNINSFSLLIQPLPLTKK